MGRKNSKKKKKEHTTHAQTVKGILDITRSGMGFVSVENLPEDVIVRPGDFNTALHGDTVRVKIKEERKSGRRMQGIVTEILRRKQTEFLGKMQMNDARPDDPVGRGFGFFIAETVDAQQVKYSCTGLG